VEEFSVTIREPRQNLPSGSWVSKGWEPLCYTVAQYQNHRDQMDSACYVQNSGERCSRILSKLCMLCYSLPSMYSFTHL